jgi:hypothetical protein
LFGSRLPAPKRQQAAAVQVGSSVAPRIKQRCLKPSSSEAPVTVSDIWYRPLLNPLSLFSSGP